MRHFLSTTSNHYSANISSNICWHGNDTVILYLYSSRYSLLPGMETQQMIVDDVAVQSNDLDHIQVR